MYKQLEKVRAMFHYNAILSEKEINDENGKAVLMEIRNFY